MKTKEEQVAEWMATKPVIRHQINDRIVEITGEDRRATFEAAYDSVAPEWAKQEKVAARSTARTALRAQYMLLPPYIRGPMFPAFIAANQLLDLGMDADAAEIIEYAAPPPKFNQVKQAEFETIRQAFATAIAALPPLTP